MRSGRSDALAPATPTQAAPTPVPGETLPQVRPKCAVGRGGVASSRLRSAGRTGPGGMGVVYLARNKLMDRREVLKVVNKALLTILARWSASCARSARRRAPPQQRGGLQRRAGRRILLFAMEYVEGEDLASGAAPGPLPVPYACHYVAQAAMGLQHAHEKGMVHRDIKPQNLMLRRRGRNTSSRSSISGWPRRGRREAVTDLTGSGHDGHAGLHGAGADAGRGQGRCPGGHLQPGLHAVLPAHRRVAVHGQERLRVLETHLSTTGAAESGSRRLRRSWRRWCRR